MKTNTLHTGVLVIGAGVAGLRCAISLHEAGKEVLLVGDNRLGDGHATLATGGINAVHTTETHQANEDVAMHLADTRQYGEGLGDPHMVETLVTHAPQELQTLIKRGAHFQHTPDGTLATRLYGPQSQARSFFSTQAVGKEIMQTLALHAKSINLQFLEQTTIIELLEEDNQIRGAVGIQHTNEHTIINASVVVLATGGYTSIYHRSSSHHHENFGDGIAMGYLAGATLQDMEFTQFHPTGLANPIEYEGMIVKEIERYQGAILVNHKGERFMRKYDLKRLELAPASVVCHAIMDQIRTGNKVFLDMSTSIEENFLSSQSDIIKQLTKQSPLIQIAPTAHFSMGGLAVDPVTLQTTLPGLYAIGECTAGLHGANRLPGNSLMESLVFGAVLGSHLGKQPISRQESTYEYTLELPQEGTLSPLYVIDRIRSIMLENVSIALSAGYLTYAMSALEDLQKKLSHEGLKLGSNLYESIILHKRCLHLITLANAITKSMYFRQESRGSFTRSDFPETSDSYLKHSLLSYTGGKHHLARKEADLPSIKILRAIQSHPPTTRYGLVE